MTISWKIPIERLGSDDDQLLEHAHDLMPLFVMDPEEYRVRNGSIEALRMRFASLGWSHRSGLPSTMLWSFRNGNNGK
jgi:hypothetical protein